MPNGKPFDPLSGLDESAPEGAPLGGTKAEAMQRLKIGAIGLGTMVVVVGVASVVTSQADFAEQSSVPDAAATTEPVSPPAQRDPLADAGVVPDLQADLPDPEPQPHLEPLGNDGRIPMSFDAEDLDQGEIGADGQ